MLARTVQIESLLQIPVTRLYACRSECRRCSPWRPTVIAHHDLLFFGPAHLPSGSVCMNKPATKAISTSNTSHHFSQHSVRLGLTTTFEGCLAPEDLTPQRAPHGGVAQDSDRLRGQHWNSILLSSVWFEAKSDSYEYLQTLLYRYVRKMYQGDASPYWCEDWTELRSLQSKKKNQLNHRPYIWHDHEKAIYTPDPDQLSASTQTLINYLFCKILLLCGFVLLSQSFYPIHTFLLIQTLAPPTFVVMSSMLERTTTILHWQSEQLDIFFRKHTIAMNKIALQQIWVFCVPHLRIVSN